MGEVDAEDKDTTARTTTWGRSTLEQSDMMIFTCATNTTCHAPAFSSPPLQLGRHRRPKPPWNNCTLLVDDVPPPHEHVNVVGSYSESCEVKRSGHVMQRALPTAHSGERLQYRCLCIRFRIHWVRHHGMCEGQTWCYCRKAQGLQKASIRG